MLSLQMCPVLCHSLVYNYALGPSLFTFPWAPQAPHSISLFFNSKLSNPMSHQSRHSALGIALGSSHALHIVLSRGLCMVQRRHAQWSRGPAGLSLGAAPPPSEAAAPPSEAAAPPSAWKVKHAAQRSALMSLMSVHFGQGHTSRRTAASGSGRGELHTMHTLTALASLTKVHSLQLQGGGVGGGATTARGAGLAEEGGCCSRTAGRGRQTGGV